MSRFVLVRFVDEQPVYSLVERGGIRPVDAKERQGNLPVMALAPDHLLYFFLLQAPAKASRRSQLRTLHIQMQTALPSAQEDGSAHVMFAPSGHPLALYTHPELKAFWERHEDILSEATWVSSEFYLAFCAAMGQGEDAWMWRDDAGPTARFEDGELRYAPAAYGDVDDSSKDPLPVYNLARSIKILEDSKTAPAKVALPLHRLLGRERVGLKAIVVVLALLTIAGGLFIGGEAVRWKRAVDQVDLMSKKVDDEYRSVLTPPLGKDPYGRLLFAVEQARGGQVGGVDAMGLLESLSLAAPSSFRVRSLSMGAEGGSLRATAESLEVMDAMLAKLEGDESYRVTLEQAWNTADGVELSLSLERAQ